MYLNVFVSSDVQGWARERIQLQSEVECVDLLLRMQEEIVSVTYKDYKNL